MIKGQKKFLIDNDYQQLSKKEYFFNLIYFPKLGLCSF